MKSGDGASTDAAPLSAITDRKAHTGTQIKAIRRVWASADAGEITRADGRELLKKAAWARASFYEVRIAALDELLVDEANLNDTRHMMRLMLPTETQWNVIDFIGKAAVARQWKDLTTALVRCWSRPVPRPPDDQRPERFAIEQLHPQRSAEESIFAVFAGEPGLAPAERSSADNREREEQEAWALLRRLDITGERTRTLLAQSSPSIVGDNQSLATLLAGARDLGIVPDTAEQLSWLQRLRRPENSAFWSETSSIVASLGAEQRAKLSMRHLPGIRWAADAHPDWLTASREDLLSQLDSMLQGRKRYVAEGASTAAKRAPESLQTWRDSMSWGDALMALTAAHAVMDPTLISTIFVQVDEDRNDTSTEYGGVIDGTAQGFTVRFFPPRPSQRYGDRRFVASSDLIEQGATSIFHYHHHCTDYSNTNYASPSAEDQLYASRHGRGCLIFTCINKNLLNADYFDGVSVIDLGELRRPE